MPPKKVLVKGKSRPTSTLSPRSEVALRLRLEACSGAAGANADRSSNGGDAEKKKVNQSARSSERKIGKRSDPSAANVPEVKPAVAAKRAKVIVKAKPAPKRKHVLPDKMPKYLVFKDLSKKYWEIGDIVGQGGFGYLYSAKLNDDSTQNISDNNFVLKVEPHDNGPLFTELHFYQKVAKPEMIEDWVKSHKLDHLGIPRYHGHGPQDFNNKKYRFIVIDRCGKDLQKTFEEIDGVFTLSDVILITSQVVNVLNYMHSNEYVHADIKGGNLLLGYNTNHSNHVYLVDFGLVSRYTVDGVHRAYKVDPKRRHDGTPEFTSRDAHQGYFPSRRGDFEILGYCMLYWLSGTLPWIDQLENLDEVCRQKVHYMSNIGKLLDKCDLSGSSRLLMQKYLEYTVKLGYSDKPEYNLLQQMLGNSMKDIKGNMKGAFSFTKIMNRNKPTGNKTSRKKSHK